MRSAPLRTLDPGALIVDEAEGVYKLTKIDYVLPQNRLSIEVTHQMTGASRERLEGWDAWVTTEDACSVEIEGVEGTVGTVTVELAALADEENRPVYRYEVADQTGRLLAQETGLRLGVGVAPSNKQAMISALNSLAGAWENYRAWVRGANSEPLWAPECSEWCYEYRDEIDEKAFELGQELGLAP
jgi:hypothetical protein